MGKGLLQVRKDTQIETIKSIALTPLYPPKTSPFFRKIHTIYDSNQHLTDQDKNNSFGLKNNSSYGLLLGPGASFYA